MSKICPVCGLPIPQDSASCPSCGFKLPDRTQSFAPINLEAAGNTAPRALLADASLDVVRGEQVGKQFHLAGRKVEVGRSPQCEIFLNDMTVSRNHAFITYDASGYTIHDNDSYNGVWVNNANVRDAVLKDGDIIQISSFCLMFRTQTVM